MENISVSRYSTIEYYNQNAAEFVNSTIDADMKNIYAEFEKYIDIGGAILDLGCGSGRDSLYFYEKGYQVVAVDPSSAMCDETRSRVPIEVLRMRAEEIEFIDKFDAVWACASLLHVAKEDMQVTLSKIVGALKGRGIFYGSWKYGQRTCFDRERYFVDYTEEEMTKLVVSIKNIEILRMWITEDVRTEKSDTRWLNVLIRKTEMKI